MRWKVAITWRGAGNVREDREEVVTDLVRIGQLIDEGPAGWSTAYTCITELVEGELPAPPPAAETPQQAAA